MRYKAQLVGVGIGGMHGIERSVQIFGNDKADMIAWAKEKIKDVNRKNWPSAQILIYELVETVVDRVELPPPPEGEGHASSF